MVRPEWAENCLTAERWNRAADTAKQKKRPFGHCCSKSALGVTSPFPLQVQATRTISAVPSALKRFIRATRMWISAVWYPKDLRPRLFASALLRA